MPNSLQGKPDSHLRLVSDEEALVYPEGAPATDDSPTVISKATPSVDSPGSSQHKITDLSQRHATPESIVAGLRGRRLAHFELIEPIGVGGMAAVIRARDTQLDRFVALKILPPEMAQEQENVDRFHQEAKAAAKLDHENIARVFFCGVDQGLYFIAFEFVEGINLRTMLERRGRLPVAEAARYVLQIATGLEHAATRGVVHRDVKPSNIIISPNGRAKLVDMGLARNLERRGEKDLTQSGVTLGTFDYISPEQALEPREADARSDIYSLGCTLYHMLTGQAPVPEGTPAKKLHHHQHLAPTDPREIDPIIPDEIVMILGKMMAKNPKDRYQRPIHLVHHLMQVAQKIGVADDLPEGVLFVDTPLPSRPRSRPILLVGLALTVLVAVTLLVSLMPEPDRVIQSTTQGNGKKDTPVNPDGGNSGTKDPVAAGHPDLVRSRSDLQQVLDDPAKSVVAKIAEGTIDLDGLVYKGGKGQRLEINAADLETHIVKFQYQNPNTPVGLVLEGGDEVVFKHIRFVIDSEMKPTSAVAAVAVRGAKTVKFEHCIFPQNVTKISAKYLMASVLIDAPEHAEHAEPNVYFESCHFDANLDKGGQAAVAINGPANVHMTNCTFSPRCTFIQFRDRCTVESTVVNLKWCTGFVVLGPAFSFTENASARLRVNNSVFSRPESKLPEPSPGLIYFAGNEATQYEGRKNLYHNLNHLIQGKTSFGPRADVEFQAFLERNKGYDKDSRHLVDLTPGPLVHAKPLDPLAGSDPMVFQLKPEFHDDYGVRELWSDIEMPKAAPALVKGQPTTPKKKFVDADDPGAFSNNLAGALTGAVDGDVIYIKHGNNARVAFPPVTLRPGISVTLKPFDATYQPILVLDKAFRDKDSFLFKVQSGTLQIEQMEILLDPVQAGHESQSVVHLGETGHCVFKNCIFSLRASVPVQLNVVTVVDLAQMMKMDAPPPVPARVEFHECFVRGKGDLVALRGCRSLQVEMKNSLVALDGSLLDIEAANKAMPMNQGVSWKMDRSSIFTTESIFALRTKTGKVMTETSAEIDHCLLVSVAPKQPVVYHDKAVLGDLDKYLKWKGDENFYANFENLPDWKFDFKEIKSVYDRPLTFPKLNDENIQILWDATPDWFAPMEAELKSINGFGRPAESEKRLMPTPPDES